MTEDSQWSQKQVAFCILNNQMVNHVLSHLPAVLRIQIRLRWLPVVSVILPWLEMSETHLQKAALKAEDQDDLDCFFIHA